MNIENTHERCMPTSLEKALGVFNSLATLNDLLWPNERWPRMSFKPVKKVAAKGGHGPIRYTIVSYNPEGEIVFEFRKPKGFIGTHSFVVRELDDNRVLFRHRIRMKVNFKGGVLWFLVIRPLHDALLEDAFDKAENYLTGTQKRSTWSVWVRLMRRLLAAK
ncbi:SRPBCC family protein [Tenacibaculum litopenaei]|uniref:hypothetical protein n=1 Tax=Tenacibaculum litopenaei TaxID=396016 RepID=UPI0038B600FD